MRFVPVLCACCAYAMLSLAACSSPAGNGASLRDERSLPAAAGEAPFAAESEAVSSAPPSAHSSTTPVLPDPLHLQIGRWVRDASESGDYNVTAVDVKVEQDGAVSFGLRLAKAGQQRVIPLSGQLQYDGESGEPVYISWGGLRALGEDALTVWDAQRVVLLDRESWEDLPVQLSLPALEAGQRLESVCQGEFGWGVSVRGDDSSKVLLFDSAGAQTHAIPAPIPKSDYFRASTAYDREYIDLDGYYLDPAEGRFYTILPIAQYREEDLVISLLRHEPWDPAEGDPGALPPQARYLVLRKEDGAVTDSFLFHSVATGWREFEGVWSDPVLTFAARDPGARAESVITADLAARTGEVRHHVDPVDPDGLSDQLTRSPDGRYQIHLINSGLNGYDVILLDTASNQVIYLEGGSGYSIPYKFLTNDTFWKPYEGYFYSADALEVIRSVPLPPVRRDLWLDAAYAPDGDRFAQLRSTGRDNAMDTYELALLDGAGNELGKVTTDIPIVTEKYSMLAGRSLTLSGDAASVWNGGDLLFTVDFSTGQVWQSGAD